MDIDELLAAVSTRLTSLQDRRSLAAIVEETLRKRLCPTKVAIWSEHEPLPDMLQAAPASTRIRVPVPLPAGSRKLWIIVLPESGDGIGPGEQRFLERVAAVYALAARASPGIPARLQDDGFVRDGAAPLIGHSEAMQALRERIARVASTDFTVLIEGESGSGKELVARHVHELSARRQGPFVAVNCAAIVDTLLEAELFGIEDRTATGVRGRRGKFEQASGGTLFLDEVSDLAVAAQAKLLRAIQELAVERVGGQRTRHVDIRIIVATNRRLKELAEHGLFRPDLFYRLSGVELVVPALRTRREDVPELARYFLERHRHIRALDISSAAMDALCAYDWPGNVRELERTIESALTLACGDRLELTDLPPEFRGRYLEVLQPSVVQRDSLHEWGRRYVSLVFEKCGGNKREACRVLDISYHTLQAYLGHPAARPRGRPVSARVVAQGQVTPPPLVVHERGSYAAVGRVADVVR
jgi:DNA-binding NtrC family response regulator